MCSPGGMGKFSLGTSAIGAGMGFASSIYGAQAQQEDLRTAAFMDDINAKLAENSAQGEMERGNWQAGMALARGTTIKNQQTTSFAANGIDVGSASVARVKTGTDVASQIDADTIQANAVRSAWGYRTQATSYSNDALMKRAQASAISPLMAGLTSLVGGASDVAGKWYTLNKAGAFGAAPAGT